MHKTDVGGVVLGLRDADEVRHAYEVMATALGSALGGVVVQPMVEPGIETIVGVTQDPSFGPLVLFGMGGVGAELVRDTALRLVPLTDVDAADLVRSLRSTPLLFGYRGAAPADVDALEDLLAARRHARRRHPAGARARLQPGGRAGRRGHRDRHQDPPRPHSRPPRRRRPPPPRARMSSGNGLNAGMEPPEPGTSEPVEVEERGRRIVLILLIIVVVVFALIVLVSALAPDDKTSDSSRTHVLASFAHRGGA